MTSPLRIGIVEDDPRLRADFTKLISAHDDMTCVAGFASAEEALDGVRAVHPDVMLVDINLPGMSGIELVRHLRAGTNAAQIVMLTTFDDATTVFESLKAGANGYVLKRAVLGELVDAIRDVASGGAPMTGAIARKVVQYFGQRGPAPEVETLTDREREVLVALSQGQQYKEIADTLRISINTVRKYIRTIYDKLHVNTRLDAVNKLGRT
jgi:DNA-binding NarL/FixJ family response regulator